MKKLLTLIVALALIFGVAAPASAEPLLGRLIRFALSPLTGAVEIIGTTAKNVAERDGINIFRAMGRGVINGVARPFEELGYLVANEEITPVMENNVLADNDLAADLVGIGATVGATSAIAGTPIKYLQLKQLGPAIGVPVVTSIIQDANK